MTHEDLTTTLRDRHMSDAELLITMATPVMQGHDQWDLALAQYQAIQEL
jgi:hypothetical protein